MRDSWLGGAVGMVLLLASCETVRSWDKTLPLTAEVLGVRRGLRALRGEIHLHSPYSHDACDGKPLVDGQPDPTCLADLRRGLCQTHQDFAMLTDHADFVAQTDWDALFLPGPGDTPILVNGEHIASAMACPDGSSVLLMVGSENDLMPIGLHSHVAATPDERHQILRGSDAASADIYRAHGALVAIAHGESHSDSQVSAVAADALEIYNIHANLGPDIRLAMGLDPNKPLIALLPFLFEPDPKLEPDMALLAFWEENAAELARLDTAWGAGRHVVATVGVDAHENVLPGHLTDDERGDSYRRILRWFSNRLLVPEVTPAALIGAIQRGRAYGVFELFGTEVGFDFHAESSRGISEIGDTVAVADHAELVLAPPTDARVSGADLRLRILRIDATGSTEIAAGPGTAPLRVHADAAGAYRAEVRVVPRHLRRYLSTLSALADQEFVWIYTSPIYAQK